MQWEAVPELTGAAMEKPRSPLVFRHEWDTDRSCEDDLGVEYGVSRLEIYGRAKQLRANSKVLK